MYGCGDGTSLYSAPVSWRAGFKACLRHETSDNNPKSTSACHYDTDDPVPCLKGRTECVNLKLLLYLKALLKMFIQWECWQFFVSQSENSDGLQTCFCYSYSKSFSLILEWQSVKLYMLTIRCQIHNTVFRRDLVLLLRYIVLLLHLRVTVVYGCANNLAGY
jgi:hypothetical protein